MDAFVETIRNINITNYTTTNWIGAKEIQTIYDGGTQQKLEVPKTKISLEDLFSGDNYYGERMKLEYEAVKKLHPDQDFSQKEYQLAILNSRAFEYESIKDFQENKELWGQTAALVVIVGVSLVCPPAGMALGAVYGSLELKSAITGKDWISGRELGTSERWVRGLLSPLDIVPGVSAVSKFSSATRTLNLGKNAALFGMKTGVKAAIQRGIVHVDDLVKEAEKLTSSRLRNAGSAIKDGANVVKNKIIKDTIELADLADSTVTFAKKINPFTERAALTPEGVPIRMEPEKTHVFGDKARSFWKIEKDGVSVGSKGTGKDRQIDYTKGFDVEPKYSSYEQRVKTTPVNKGKWSSERAESLFISDKTGEIKKYLDEAGVDGVEYKNGMPDFSPFSKGEVKLDNMTNDRKLNFSTADEELAKKWSTPDQKWTAEDIADWREDNKYTWHELNDLETIQLVPSKINSVFKHLGGVGEYNIKVKLGE